jgi:hypothetical protein
MKGAGLHFLAVVASITVIYLIVPISPSSSQTTVWFLALLLVIGAVSLFKLIGYLAIAMWHLLWFVTAPHSPRKRRLELWGVVVAGAGMGTIFFYVAVGGLVSDEILFPGSRLGIHVSLSEAPILYWLSEAVYFVLGAVILYFSFHAGINMLRGLPPHSTLQEIRDNAAQRL